MSKQHAGSPPNQSFPLFLSRHDVRPFRPGKIDRRSSNRRESNLHLPELINSPFVPRARNKPFRKSPLSWPPRCSVRRVIQAVARPRRYDGRLRCSGINGYSSIALNSRLYYGGATRVGTSRSPAPIPSNSTDRPVNKVTTSSRFDRGTVPFRMESWVCLCRRSNRWSLIDSNRRERIRTFGVTSTSTMNRVTVSTAVPKFSRTNSRSVPRHRAIRTSFRCLI